MKVSSSIKILCKGCRFTKRNKILYVLCSINNKHKQRQG